MSSAAPALRDRVLRGAGCAAVAVAAVAAAGQFGRVFVASRGSGPVAPSAESRDEWTAAAEVPPPSVPPAQSLPAPLAPLAGPARDAPQVSLPFELPLPDGAEPLPVPLPPMVRGYRCPLSAAETAEFLRRRLAEAGWRVRPTPNGPHTNGPNREIRLWFARPDARCLIRLEDAPRGAGCRMFVTGFAVEGPGNPLCPGGG